LDVAEGGGSRLAKLIEMGFSSPVRTSFGRLDARAIDPASHETQLYG
jgi:hypothetical protein